MIAAALLFALLGFANLTPERAAQEAVERSPEIAAAQARVAQSAALLAAARDGLAPAFAANYVQAPQGNPPGPNIISRLVTVGLQTNVADFIAYGPAVREGILGLEASRADAAVAEREERLKTLGLYFEALKTREIADLRERALSLASAQRDAARTRFTVGDAPRLDVVRAEVAVSRARAEAETARAADQNATDALSLETGRAREDLQATVDAAPPAASPRAQNPDDLARHALRERAEIGSALAREHAAEAARGVAAAARFPSLAITGGYTAGTDSDVPVGAPSLAVALTLPLGASPGRQIALEDARVAEARAQVEAARRSVSLEVAAAARTLGALERAAAASTQARRGAEAEVAATELGYRSGASSSLEVESARAAYAEASIDELSALYDVERARRSLELQIER